MESISKTIKYPNYYQYKNKKGIYKITVGTKEYIGSSVDLYKRMLRHIRTLMIEKHENIHLQRCYNKYSKYKIEVLEIVDENSTYKYLLEREKYYIDLLKPKLNQKLDPVTQQNSKNVSKEVYQFDQKGNFLKKWPSAQEASRYYKMDSAAITVSIKRPWRQRLVKGFLWSHDKICRNIKLLYVYDSKGNFIGDYINTVGIYNSLYSVQTNRKSVLSVIKSLINTDKEYMQYRIFDNYKGDFYEKTYFSPKEIRDLEFFHKYDLEGNFIATYSHKELTKLKLLLDVKNILRGNAKSLDGFMWSNIKLERLPEYSSKRAKKVIAYNDTYYKEFRSLSKCIKELYNIDDHSKEYTRISRILKNSSDREYNGYCFKRV